MDKKLVCLLLCMMLFSVTIIRSEAIINTNNIYKSEKNEFNRNKKSNQRDLLSGNLRDPNWTTT